MKWDEKRSKALTNQMLCQLSYAGFVSARNMPLHPRFVQPLRSDCVRSFQGVLPVRPIRCRLTQNSPQKSGTDAATSGWSHSTSLMAPNKVAGWTMLAKLRAWSLAASGFVPHACRFQTEQHGIAPNSSGVSGCAQSTGQLCFRCERV